MTFSNPIAALSGLLQYPAIYSRDYVPGTSGWIIRRNGTAEFNSLGGSFQINDDGIFFYIPTAGSGNLVASFSDTGGFDQYGNQYIGGFFLNQHQAHFTGDMSHTVRLNPDGASGPLVDFTAAGFNTMFQILGDSVLNRMLMQAVSVAGTYLEFNLPVKATGGYQAVHTSAGAQPPFTSTGTFVAYSSAAWTPVDIVCPPSETIQVTTTIQGHNVNSVNSNVAVQNRVNDQTNGGALLFTPTTATATGPIVTSRSTTDTTDLEASLTFTWGKDVLGGLAGHTIRFTPMWRISSGGAGTSSIGLGSIVAMPSLFELLTSG